MAGARAAGQKNARHPPLAPAGPSVSVPLAAGRRPRTGTGSQPFGMMTFDQCIADLYKENLISEDTALSYSSRKGVVGRALDSIKSERGEKTTSIEELAIDTDYGKDEQKQRR